MRRRLAGFLVAGFVCSTTAAASAHGDYTPGLVLLVLPGSTGPEFRMRGSELVDLRWVIAFPYQIPIGEAAPHAAHRIVVAGELVAWSSEDDGGNDGMFVRGRAGYRYVWNELLFGGLGFSVDAESLYVSPELGVRAPGLPKVYAVIRYERALLDDLPYRVYAMLGVAIY